ncbi:MAG: hypothetical protein HQK81_02335 [Desulfovibrionaceae bacterium]|nr:hypothetical protein [Desulfovibrionaceae bacterium]MBF0512883.1 hypothetical protein [Desulfovibrionaceae bacterium]
MKKLWIACAALAALLLAGCNEDRRTTWDHGEATKEIFASQIANPEAGKSNAPGAGLDGKAAERVIKTYQEGDDKTKQSGPAPAINLNLNSGGSQGSGQ